MSHILLLTEEFSAFEAVSDTGSRETKRAVPGLSQDGFPNSAASQVVSEFLAATGERTPNVTVILPSRLIRTRRVFVDIDVHGVVGQHHLAHALEEIRGIVPARQRVILYAQPSGFLHDGVVGVGDPVGMSVGRLTIDATVMCAAATDIRAFETFVADAGGRLVDVVASSLCAAAADVGEAGTGAVLHMGFGETSLVVLRNHFVVAGASCSIGFRHLIQDVAVVSGEASSGAAGTVRQLMQRVPRKTLTSEEMALDARLAELAEWAGPLLASAEVDHLVLSGEIDDSRRLAAVWPSIALTESPLASRGPMAPLIGARALIDGRTGCHEPARLSVGGARLPVANMFRWLRHHF